MRKKVLGKHADLSLTSDDKAWLNLEDAAQVEVTSECAQHPIEAAFRQERNDGWRASEPGEQTVRLCFDEPQSLRCIRVEYVEEERARTQEFALRWSSDGGRSYQEIVRQQFTFSPPNTRQEIEEYNVELAGVTALELRIIPDIQGGQANASLARLQVA